MDGTTQSYIDGQRWDDEKDAARRRRAKAYEKTRKEVEKLKLDLEKAVAGLKDKEREFKSIMAGQLDEVKVAKAILVDEERRLLDLRSQRTKHLRPMRSEVRRLTSLLSSEEQRCDELKPSPKPIRGKTISVYRDDETSWPGPSTDLFEVCKPEQAVPVPGGLADGRGRAKQKPKRIGIKRRAST